MSPKTAAFGDDPIGDSLHFPANIRVQCIENAASWEENLASPQDDNNGQPKWAAPVVEGHPFVDAVTVLVPGCPKRRMHDALVASITSKLKLFPVFVIYNLQLGSLADPGVATYLFRQRQCGLVAPSIAGNVDTDDQGVVAVLPSGVLYIRVHDSLFKRLGLAAPRVKTCGAEKRLHGPYRLLELNLLNNHPVNGTRLAWALGESQTRSMTLSGFFSVPLDSAASARDTFAAELTRLLTTSGSPEASVRFFEITTSVERYTGGRHTAFSSAVETDMFAAERHTGCVPNPDPRALWNALTDKSQSSTAEELMEFAGKVVLNIPVDPYAYGWLEEDSRTSVISVIRLHCVVETGLPGSLSRELPATAAVGHGVSRCVLQSVWTWLGSFANPGPSPTLCSAENSDKRESPLWAACSMAGIRSTPIAWQPVRQGVCDLSSSNEHLDTVLFLPANTQTQKPPSARNLHVALIRVGKSNALPVA